MAQAQDPAAERGWGARGEESGGRPTALGREGRPAEGPGQSGRRGAGGREPQPGCAEVHQEESCGTRWGCPVLPHPSHSED